MNFEIPTADDIRTAVRAELTAFFATFQFPTDRDEIGRGAKFASHITGKAVPTIYSLVNADAIPHSKRGKDLYFSRRELEEWLRSGRRMTQREAAATAAELTA